MSSNNQHVTRSTGGHSSATGGSVDWPEGTTLPHVKTPLAWRTLEATPLTIREPNWGSRVSVVLVALCGVLWLASIVVPNPVAEGSSQEHAAWLELRALAAQGQYQLAHQRGAARLRSEFFAGRHMRDIRSALHAEIGGWNTLGLTLERRNAATAAFRTVAGATHGNPVRHGIDARAVLRDHRDVLDPTQRATLQQLVDTGARHRYVDIQSPTRRRSRRADPCPAPAVRYAGATTWQTPPRRYYAPISEVFRYEARCTANGEVRAFEVLVPPGASTSGFIARPSFD